MNPTNIKEVNDNINIIVENPTLLTQFKTKFKYYNQKFLEKINNIDHIKVQNITYFSHMKEALVMSSYMLFGSVTLLVHSIFPNILTTTGSSTIKQLYNKVVKNQKLI